MAALPLQLQIILNRLGTSASRLQQQGPNWIHNAEAVRTMQDVICQIVHYDANGRNVFIIVECAKVIPSTTIATIAGLNNIQADWLKRDGRESTVTEMFDCALQNPGMVELVLTSRVMQNSNILVPLTSERCVRISYTNFQTDFAVLG